jgi:hypothetical protein
VHSLSLAERCSDLHNSLNGLESDTRMVSSIAIAIFSGAVLVLAIIQYAATSTLSPLNVKTNDKFPKVELAQRVFGLFYLVAAVVRYPALQCSVPC